MVYKDPSGGPLLRCPVSSSTEPRPQTAASSAALIPNSAGFCDLPPACLRSSCVVPSKAHTSVVSLPKPHVLRQLYSFHCGVVIQQFLLYHTRDKSWRLVFTVSWLKVRGPIKCVYFRWQSEREHCSQEKLIKMTNLKTNSKPLCKIALTAQSKSQDYSCKKWSILSTHRKMFVL